MLGNDIVDLAKARAESNWLRKGYLDKVFSAQEQESIFQSVSPHTLLWCYWSMKEAAYKITNRQTKLRFYAPKKFSCSDIDYNSGTGTVTYENQVFKTQSLIAANFVHSTAIEQVKTAPQLATIYLPNQRAYLSSFNSQQKEHYLTKNKYGIPELLERSTGQQLITSLSHHGRYLAISYLKA
jgi:phosphopantetheinyl transferase (holo-ACP synthase)